MDKKFYITTSIAYANSRPHVGYSLELIQADVLARYHRLIGEDVYFLTGTDEHGLTVVKAAQKTGKDTKEFVDEIAGSFQELTKVSNISNDDFIRTSDQKRHWPAAVKIWKALAVNGDLYKKEYEGLYCIGHEAFIKKSELVDGLCPLHKTEPEPVKEENWFFKLTKYKNEIKKLIENDDVLILPVTKKRELLNLIDDSEDVSFSRPRSKLEWGIPVPDDPDSTVYVWSDALVNYLSALGYADDGEIFKKFWPADIHLIGKDILRFHALIWPAMLLSAGIELPKSIYVHGFITVDGQKMSKTIGNVIDPFAMIKKYGADVLRYYLLREIPSDEDGDFSEKRLVQRYNGDLANGLGNLVQRVATLIENNLDGELIYESKNLVRSASDFDFKEFGKWFDGFKLHEALNQIWKYIGEANAFIDERKPWTEAKSNPAEFLKTVTTVVKMIHEITWTLKPFIPETSQKIFATCEDHGQKEIGENYHFRIKKGEVLFPRLQ